MDRLVNKLPKQQSRRLLLKSFAALFSAAACGINPELTDQQVSNFCVQRQRAIFLPPDNQPTVADLAIREVPPGSNDLSNSNIYLIYGLNEPERVTNEPNMNDLYPQLSKDGKKIVFARSGPWKHLGQRYYEAESTPDNGIYTINPDGTSLNRVVSTPNAQTVDSWPTISSDGSRIAFRRRDKAKGKSYLYTVDADGQNQKLVFEIEERAHFSIYEFSPDGSKLAINYDGITYIADSEGKVMPISDPNDQAKKAEYLHWLPDNNHLIIHQEDYSQKPATTRLILVHADGSTSREVTLICPLNQFPDDE